MTVRVLRSILTLLKQTTENNKMSFSNDPKFVTAFTQIACMFLVRKGFSLDEATFEIKIIKERIGLEKFVAASGKGKFDNEEYIRLSRIGAKKRMNRKERINVSQSLSNAINHASIEAGYY